jgi:hypothetical protein
MRQVLFSLLLLLAIALNARAQDTSALINEALDKVLEPIQFENDIVLPMALKSISDRTGVPIEADPAVWELLPWGEQTTIKATIQNQTLREALTAITRTFGLTFEVTDESVQLQPMPALRRLGRRATLDELQSLSLLAGTTMELKTDQPTVKQLVAWVDQKLIDLKTPYAMENRSSDSVRMDRTIYVPRNATMMEALDSLASNTNATWYPWGKNIVVVPKEDQIRNQLSKTVTLRYNNADVSQVLIELSQRSGVTFSIEPGAIQRIPPEFRNVHLVLDNASIKQALEHISGFTGLAYVVREEIVYIWNKSSQTIPARDPAVGIIPLDNGMQLIITQSQLPPDMLEYFKQKRDKELGKIRVMMDEEGFKPTTQPATKPSEDL